MNVIIIVTGYRHSSVVVADNKIVSSSLAQTAVDQQQQQLQQQQSGPASAIAQQNPAPPVVRITLASMEECNVLLHNGLDFYGATFFPVEAASPVPPKKKPLAPNRYRYRETRTVERRILFFCLCVANYFRLSKKKTKKRYYLCNNYSNYCLTSFKNYLNFVQKKKNDPSNPKID